jgi:excisionase family DNA binding protein
MRDVRLAYSVNEACEAIACGRTKLYELIAGRQIKAKKLGTRTIVLADSLHDYVEGLPDLATRGRRAQ